MILVQSSYVGTYQYAKSDNFMKGKDRLQEGKEIADTLQTSGKEGVVIKVDKYLSYEKENLKQKLCNKLIENNMVEEGDVIRHSYTTSRASGEIKDIKQNNISPTLDTRCDCLGVVVNNKNNYNLRIRKLTPKECMRLMGVKDEDSEKIKQGDASIYHLAGDSIVTTCLMAIFGELLGIDYKSKIEELVEQIKN